MPLRFHYGCKEEPEPSQREERERTIETLCMATSWDCGKSRDYCNKELCTIKGIIQAEQHFLSLAYANTHIPTPSPTYNPPLIPVSTHYRTGSNLTTLMVFTLQILISTLKYWPLLSA
jgi:hypothetical protein